MSLTGVIYGGIVVLWLCYLVPLALRRYDDASRSRSVERFSTAMRVLGRTDPAAHAGDGGRPVDARALRAATQAAARAAARRRRRVLMVLLLLTAATAGAWVYGLLVWWSPLVPVALVVVFVVIARIQVARARRRTRRRLAGARAPGADRRPARVPLKTEPVAAGPVAAEPAGADPDDAPTQVLEPVEPAPVATTAGGSLWDPLPVTLPTYVSKPRAARTVRTIDLDGPGAWTSGHRDPDPKVAAEATAEAGEAGESDPARAVGD